MKIDEIRAVAKIMADNGLSLIELTEGDTHVKMERISTAIVPREVPDVASVTDMTPYEIEMEESVFAGDEFSEIRSPVVGVFYAAAEPDALPFVNIGSLQNLDGNCFGRICNRNSVNLYI